MKPTAFLLNAARAGASTRRRCAALWQTAG